MSLFLTRLDYCNAILAGVPTYQLVARCASDRFQCISSHDLPRFSIGMTMLRSCWKGFTVASREGLRGVN